MTTIAIEKDQINITLNEGDPITPANLTGISNQGTVEDIIKCIECIAYAKNDALMSEQDDARPRLVQRLANGAKFACDGRGKLSRRIHGVPKCDEYLNP